MVHTLYCFFQFRLGLERSRTASDALDVMTSLLEQYGQGGECFVNEERKGIIYHNSFIITDANEAWILETVARHWAAERVKGKQQLFFIK